MEENKNTELNENLNDGASSEITASEENTGGEKKSVFARFFTTILTWIKRAFFGAGNVLYKEIKEKEEKKDDVFAVEKIESPGKQRVKAFLHKKLAVGACIVFLAVFLVMLIGPLFYPLDLAYNEETQKNVAPGLDMMSVPRKMRDEIVEISSNSKFTVGLSKSGDVFVWGDTKLLLTDLSKIPDEVKDAKIVRVAAGTDHIIAVGDDGKVYGWGQNTNGQYGPVPPDKSALGFIYDFAPSTILYGKLNVSEIKQVVCGKQVSAIVMNDGTLYMWGNKAMGATNMDQVKKLTNVEKVVFTSQDAIVLLKDGTFSVGNLKSFDYTIVNGEKVKLKDYVEAGGKKIVDAASAGQSAAFVLDSGEVLFSGTYVNGENNIPALKDGEKIVKISGGEKHYTLLTDKGTVYSWGSNVWKQCEVPKRLSGVANIFTGPFQNYAVDEDGELIDTWGLKGYLMGTDGFGRDIWNRIVNGGRLTMTIGAIAVIISSIIGIIIGCLSGYFGGWVDMLLMRIAEVVSAIPFMPFALILSLVVMTLGLEEMTRIVLIMVILGVLSWPGLARLVRGQVLSEREKEFVTAAKAMGVKEWKIAFKHILPNVISIIIVSMTLDFAGCMLTESSLSYLGFGVRLPRPTWGNMLDGASNSIVIQSYWWQWVFPSIFLMTTTICINIIGDALRDVMDPKSNSGR